MNTKLKLLGGILAINLVISGITLSLIGCANTATKTATAAQANPSATLATLASTPEAQAAFTLGRTILGDETTAVLSALSAKEAGVKGASVTNAASATLWQDVNTANTSGQIRAIITGAGLSNTTATAAAQAAGPAPTPAVVNAIATVISTAGGAPPALPAKGASLNPALIWPLNYAPRVASASGYSRGGAL